MTVDFDSYSTSGFSGVSILPPLATGLRLLLFLKNLKRDLLAAFGPDFPDVASTSSGVFCCNLLMISCNSLKIGFSKSLSVSSYEALYLTKEPYNSLTIFFKTSFLIFSFKTDNSISDSICSSCLTSETFILGSLTLTFCNFLNTIELLASMVISDLPTGIFCLFFFVII